MSKQVKQRLQRRSLVLLIFNNVAVARVELAIRLFRNRGKFAGLDTEDLPTMNLAFAESGRRYTLKVVS